MEADLSRYHGIDLRDRDVIEQGRRKLTLLMIWRRVKWLPEDSAVARATNQYDGVRWSLTDILLAHLWQAVARSKTPHPMLAKAQRQETRRALETPEHRRRRARAVARAKERQRAIEAGEIT